jgi:hypothetical protein
MQDLVSQLAAMLSGGMPPNMPMSPMPQAGAPMSPVPPNFGALPRPAGLPGVPAPNFSPVPPGALGPNRLAPPDSATPPMPTTPPAPAPQPDLGTRPVVPQSMLEGFKEMFMAGDDTALPSGEAQGGFGGFMQDAAAGMGNIRSTAAPGAAFGAGFASAMASNTARKAAAAKQREDAEEKAYQRKRDAADYGFKFTDEERAAETHKDSRRKAKFDNLKTALEIQEKKLDLKFGGKGQLDLKKTITDDLNAWMDWWSEKNAAANADKISAEAERKRKELEEYYATKAAPATPAPAAPAPAPEGGSEVPTSGLPTPSPQASADGIPTMATPEDARKLPKGAKFRDPQGNIRTNP